MRELTPDEGRLNLLFYCEGYLWPLPVVDVLFLGGLKPAAGPLIILAALPRMFEQRGEFFCVYTTPFAPFFLVMPWRKKELAE